MSQYSYFVEKGTMRVIDVVMPDGTGKFTGKAQEAIAEKFKVELEVIGDEVLRGRVLAECCTKPERVTEDDFYDALECLPPMNWRGRGYTESFMIPEAYMDDIHSCYVRIGEGYYTLRTTASTSHDELVKQVREHFKLDH